MKKIITKHFYIISLLFLSVFFILSIYFESKLLNAISLIIICAIIFLMYKIRKGELEKIAQKFSIQQHYIEKEEDRYMSEQELSMLYNKIYNNHFNC